MKLNFVLKFSTLTRVFRGCFEISMLRSEMKVGTTQLPESSSQLAQTAHFN